MSPFSTIGHFATHLIGVLHSIHARLDAVEKAVGIVTPQVPVVEAEAVQVGEAISGILAVAKAGHMTAVIAELIAHGHADTIFLQHAFDDAKNVVAPVVAAAKAPTA